MLWIIDSRKVSHEVLGLLTCSLYIFVLQHWPILWSPSSSIWFPWFIPLWTSAYALKTSPNLTVMVLALLSIPMGMLSRVLKLEDMDLSACLDRSSIGASCKQEMCTYNHQTVFVWECPEKFLHFQCAEFKSEHDYALIKCLCLCAIGCAFYSLV